MTATSDATRTTTPYADHAHDVLASGIGSPLPVPYRQKKSPPDGYTGRDGATASGPDVQAWIEDRGGWNIAVRLAGTVVGIDVDDYGAKHGGDTLYRLEGELGQLPDTIRVTSRTGPSGIRLYRCPPDSHYKGNAGPNSHVDFIQHGHRYVMWRGSLHPDGRVYRTVDERTGEEDGSVKVDDLPELPQTWHEWMLEPVAETIATPYTGSTYREWTSFEAQAVDIYADEQVDRILYGLRAASAWPDGYTDQHGRGWDKLCADAAQTLRTLAADGWSRYDEAALHSMYVAQAPTSSTWTRRDVEAKWRSQSKPAVNGGRIAPPDLQQLLKPAADPIPPDTDALDEDDRNQPIDWVQLLDGPEVPPRFLVGQMAEHGQQVALVGAAKVGKSLLCLDWAVSIAAGLPFLGDEGHEPLRVLYVDQENNQSDLRRRVRGLGYTADQLSNFTYLSFPTIGPLDTPTGAAAFHAEIDRFCPDVVFLDTISRMIDGVESDSDTWLALYRLTLKRLKANGTACIRLDHFGKDTERGARGSSAKSQDVDQVWELVAAGKTVFDLRRTHSRTGMGEEFIRFERETDEEKTFVRHVRPERAYSGPLMFETYSATVLDAVRQLEQAGCPVLGRPATIQFSIDAKLGLMLSKANWGQVVKARKEMAQARLDEV